MTSEPRPGTALPHGGEPDGVAPRGRRLSVLDVLRGLFLVAAVGFGWWGLRGYHEQIVSAIGRSSPVRVLGAVLLVLVGLAVTGAVWRAVLTGFGHHVPQRPAASIFFVGQLGKYIPGSVWSLGAQADMARSFRVPGRTTVAAGLVFLYVHVVSALPVATLLGRWDGPEQPVDEALVRSGPLAAGITDLPWWVALLACATTVVLLCPPVLGLIGRLLAGREQPLRLTWARSALLMALMSVTWGLYGVGVLLVIPPTDLAGAGGLVGLWAPVTAAFAAAHMVGVLIVLAPAGAGARELTLIGLLAPMLGVPTATAAALLTRVVHTVDDFLIAGMAWACARTQRGRGSAAGAGGSGPIDPADAGG